MRELRLDGLSPDGSRLVLAGKDGQKYTVVIDERLMAAVRRDRARIQQVEIEQSGALRPREIQARIRAGATAEDVAAASGLPIEHIRRFEGPVLTERAWVAEQAQSTEVRRPGGDIELGDLVAERLAGADVDAAEITWDAWRRDDGIWVVIATFPLGPNTHVATWTYDSTSRTMTVADDNARSLSAIDPEDALRLVASRPTLASVAPLPDEADSAAAVLSPLVRAVPDDERPDADPGAVDEEAERVDAELEDDRLEATQSDPAAAEPAEVNDEPAEQPADEAPAGRTTDAEDVPLFDSPQPAPAPRPGQRRAVPSFDDILFGPGPGN